MLLSVIADVAPMLATSGVPSGDLADWSVEPKLDGWRARALVDDGQVRILSRRGRDITDCLPELTVLADVGRRLVLDGELVVGAGRLADFYRLAGRLSGRSQPGAEAVTFAVFDLLWLDEGPLTGETYTARRTALERLPLGGAVPVIPRHAGDQAADLYRACDEQGLEGVVLKRLSSTYRPGKRSADWRKVKCGSWADHLDRRRPSMP